MSVQGYPHPLPQADHLTQPWWAASHRHELVIQECGDCRTLRHPPQAVCSNCGSESISWRTMSGRGKLYSYVIVHQTALPSWRASVPYNIVMVELEDAPEIQLYGNVIDVEPEDLKVGLPLEVVFDDVTPDDTIVRWRLLS